MFTFYRHDEVCFILPTCWYVYANVYVNVYVKPWRRSLSAFAIVYVHRNIPCSARTSSMPTNSTGTRQTPTKSTDTSQMSTKSTGTSNIPVFTSTRSTGILYRHVGVCVVCLNQCIMLTWTSTSVFASVYVHQLSTSSTGTTSIPTSSTGTRQMSTSSTGACQY